MNPTIKRGEIYYIRDNKKSEGSEQRANRPAVVVSNDKNNEHSGVIEVVYMTTQPKTDMPTHFITHAALKPSTVLCEQISSVYIDRIGEWIGTLTPEEMEQLDECIAVSVGLNIDARQGVIKDKFDEISKLRQQVTEAREAQAATEKKATAYKEMYDFLLAKRIEQ